MKNYVSIEIDNGEFQKEVYRFYYMSGHSSHVGIMLDTYVILTRENRRQKFRVTKRWERLITRDSTMGKPEVPLDVQVEAMKQFKDSLQWSDLNEK